MEDKKGPAFPLTEYTMDWARWTVGNIVETRNCSHTVPELVVVLQKTCFPYNRCFWFMLNFWSFHIFQNNFKVSAFTKVHWKNTQRDKRKVCKYSWQPTPWHESQDVSQAVIPCNQASVTLLTIFLFYPNIFQISHRTVCICLSQFWNNILM